MHVRTKSIVDAFHINEKDLGSIYDPDKNLNANTLKKLQELGVPDAAIEQIKFFEMLATNLEKTRTDEEWIVWMLRKVKKSLSSFLKKGTPMKIVFKNTDWYMYAEAYNRSVAQLHKTCKPYFDEFASKDISLLIDLTGPEIVIKE